MMQLVVVLIRLLVVLLLLLLSVVGLVKVGRRAGRSVEMRLWHRLLLWLLPNLQICS
jgi:hypothetical protein